MSSALEDNIEQKGRNAYYYAHSHKADGPVWDKKPEPRLLKKVEPAGGSESAVAAYPITDYSYSDEDSKVKLYVSMEGAGELSDDSIDLQFTRTSFSLTVLGYQGSNRKLSFPKLFADIENAVVKKKSNKLIVVVTKAEEKDWPCIGAGTPSK